MNTPSRQFPSLITFGVSATAATVEPAHIGPLDFPVLDVEHQRDLAAVIGGAEREEAVHGHTASHEQVSKYDPSIFQDIPTPPRCGTRRFCYTRRCPSTGRAGPKFCEREAYDELADRRLVVGASPRRESAGRRPAVPTARPGSRPESRGAIIASRSPTMAPRLRKLDALSAGTRRPIV